MTDCMALTKYPDTYPALLSNVAANGYDWPVRRTRQLIVTDIDAAVLVIAGVYSIIRLNDQMASRDILSVEPQPVAARTLHSDNTEMLDMYKIGVKDVKSN